jgi:hypothetical protein
MIFQSGGSPFPVKLPTPIKKADKDDNKDGMPGMPMPGGGQ